MENLHILPKLLAKIRREEERTALHTHLWIKLKQACEHASN